MKTILISTLLLLATKSFAIPVTQLNCNDSLQEWKVVARISEGKGAILGTLKAHFRGWEVISENLNKAVLKSGGIEYFDGLGSESAFGIQPQNEGYWLKTSKGVIALTCFEESKEEQSKSCQIKTCHQDGSGFYNQLVPRDYQCRAPNIQCKI